MAVSVKAKIKQAIKANWVPGVIIQVFALIIVLLYFYYAPAQPAFSFIAGLKLTYNTSFAIISTAIFGGLLPFIILFLKKRIAKPRVLRKRTPITYCGILFIVSTYF